MKTALSIVTMLTVSPLVAVATVVCHHPDRWGGSANPLNILMMAVFGLFTVAVWPTYIPAILITPFIMRRVAVQRVFTASSLSFLLSVASLVGAVVGVCVLAPIILLALKDSAELAVSWVLAGGISGALTLMLICLIYRFVDLYAEPNAPPNGGPATPPLIPTLSEGPPSVS